MVGGGGGSAKENSGIAFSYRAYIYLEQIENSFSFSQEEIRVLRQRQKEAELSAEQERHLRTKMSDDSSSLVRENSVLNQQVIELTKQLERVSMMRWLYKGKS